MGAYFLESVITRIYLVVAVVSIISRRCDRTLVISFGKYILFFTPYFLFFSISKVWRLYPFGKLFFKSTLSIQPFTSSDISCFLLQPSCTIWYLTSLTTSAFGISDTFL